MPHATFPAACACGKRPGCLATGKASDRSCRSLGLARTETPMCCRHSSAQDDLKHLEQLRKRIVEELKSDILITPKVDLVTPESLPQSEGKAKRVIDNRKD